MTLWPAGVTATLSSSWSKQLALLCSALLGLWVLWQGARLIWLLAAGPQVPSLPLPPLPQAQPAASVRDGFRWDLFGQASRAPVDMATPVAAARGSLRLKGIMAGGADAFAIIADEQGREQVYRAGDALPDGSRVEQIETLRVILWREGRREALDLTRQSPVQAGPSAGGQSGSNTWPGRAGLAAPSGISAASLQPGTLSQTAISGALSEQISILPVAGGGFRVRPGRDARLFAALGLQINDVVVAVNGQPLETEDEARALFADVLRRGELSITIQREGREMSLRPDLSQILSSL